MKNKELGIKLNHTEITTIVMKINNKFKIMRMFLKHLRILLIITESQLCQKENQPIRIELKML